MSYPHYKGGTRAPADMVRQLQLKLKKTVVPFIVDSHLENILSQIIGVPTIFASATLLVSTQGLDNSSTNHVNSVGRGCPDVSAPPVWGSGSFWAGFATDESTRTGYRCKWASYWYFGVPKYCREIWY